MQIERFIFIGLNYKFPYIIQVLVDNIDNLKDMSYIFLNIGLGVGAFRGLSYLKTYKKREMQQHLHFGYNLELG